MTARPLFSVVLPTKNRSQLVGNAIQSVLQQSLGDFELILCDNDDTDATRRVVRSFHDPRIHYLRTGGLSMADNWEHAGRAARGEYLTVLEDKQVLRPWTLARLRQAIDRHSAPPVLTWHIDQIDDRGPTLYTRHVRRRDDDVVVSSDEVLRTFVSRSRAEALAVLPRGINSCCRRAVVERIRRGPAGRLFLPVAPDCTSAFLLLAEADWTVQVRAGLALVGRACSTGQEFKAKTELGKQFLVESKVRPQDLYQEVPIKTAFLPTNLMWNDYLRLRRRLGGRLAAFGLDVSNYFREALSDIREMQMRGTDMAEERSAWEAALRAQPAKVQRAVLGLPERLPLRRRLKQTLKAVARWLLWRPRPLPGPVPWDQPIDVPHPGKLLSFPNMLAAAAWEENPESLAS